MGECSEKEGRLTPSCIDFTPVNGRRREAAQFEIIYGPEMTAMPNVESCVEHVRLFQLVQLVLCIMQLALQAAKI